MCTKRNDRNEKPELHSKIAANHYQRCLGRMIHSQQAGQKLC